MIFGDNQTKHFYVIPASNGYTVKDLENSDLVTLILNQDNNQKVTTDVINRKLIKHAKINKVKPTFLRKWTTLAISSNDLKPATTYHIYFYLENMMGFGMQDRWDRVASYTTDIYDNSGTPATHDTISTVMQHLAVDLYSKLNMAGPIKNDFVVALSTRTVGSAWDSTTDAESDTTSSNTRTIVAKEMINGTATKVTYAINLNKDVIKEDYVNDFAKLNPTTNANTLIVYENSASDTFTSLDALDLRMHTNPYAYNVTMSTSMTTEKGIEPWGGQKQILATNTSDKYINSATKVMAMELYFLRNRADKYDLTKDFYASILNKPQTITANADYYTLDIDYAFSDTQGYTYHSDKQLSIACGAPASESETNPALTTLENLRKAILKDSNETSLGYTDTATYTQAPDDED